DRPEGHSLRVSAVRVSASIHRAVRADVSVRRGAVGGLGDKRAAYPALLAPVRGSTVIDRRGGANRATCGRRRCRPGWSSSPPGWRRILDRGLPRGPCAPLPAGGPDRGNRSTAEL